MRIAALLTFMVGCACYPLPPGAVRPPPNYPAPHGGEGAALVVLYFVTALAIGIGWAWTFPIYGDKPERRRLMARLTLLAIVPPLPLVYLFVQVARWLWREAFPAPPRDATMTEAEREVEATLRKP